MYPRNSQTVQTRFFRSHPTNTIAFSTGYCRVRTPAASGLFFTWFVLQVSDGFYLCFDSPNLTLREDKTNYMQCTDRFLNAFSNISDAFTRCANQKKHNFIKRFFKLTMFIQAIPNIETSRKYENQLNAKLTFDTPAFPFRFKH